MKCLPLLMLKTLIIDLPLLVPTSLLIREKMGKRVNGDWIILTHGNGQFNKLSDLKHTVLKVPQRLSMEFRNLLRKERQMRLRSHKLFPFLIL